MNEPVLQCRNLLPLTSRVQESTGITLELPRFSLTCIVGPGDSGKTSWLRLLAAVDPAAGGNLRLLGQDTSWLSTAEWRRLRQQAGYVLPNSALLSSQSVLQNVALPAQYHYQHGWDTGSHAEKKAVTLLEWLECTADPNELPEYLPAYQQKLVAIARCLMLDPQILFIDEAFAFMDAQSCRKIARRYLAIRDELKITLVLATCDLAFAKAHTDRFIFTRPAGPKVYADWASAEQDNDEAVRNFIRSNFDHYSTFYA
ncbi:MAG TPA: ATP-binding cassette domain-containing protein [Gammaproteobacteria bacterium]